MKKTTLLYLMVLFFLLGNLTKAQSVVSYTFDFTGYTCQCCSNNTTPYFCFNDGGTGGSGSCSTFSGYCGSTASSKGFTFTNPVPAGNIVTQVSMSYFAYTCGGSVTPILDGTTLATDALSNVSCECSNTNLIANSGAVSTNYPCGFPGYNNAGGATETVTFDFTGNVCISAAYMKFYYAPANQAVPATQPTAVSGPTPVCPSTGGHVYSIPAVANATGYTWTVPAGWTINSGQGTTSITVTSGTSGGNVCVDAYNLCGTSAQTCFAVSLETLSTAPTSASANPNPICPSNPTTLTASGGTIGTGGNYTWYAGSCGSAVIGTGTSISVSPAVATTYFVSIAGTCNTTGCTNVTVNVNGVQPTPGAPSGTTSVCNGSSQVYTTSGSAGATSYSWSFSPVTTGAINSGQGTASVNTTIGSTSGNICVTATGACGTSAAACTPITITSIPATPGSITGTTPVCPGSYNYSIGAVTGASSYTWAITGGGGFITGGQGTTATTVNWTTAGSYIVSVFAANSCGNTTTATFPVTVNANPVITITPTSTAICSGSVGSMTASGASTYTWSPDGTITSSLISAAITVDPAITDIYTVTATDGNGCKNTATQSILVNQTPTVTVSGGGGNSQTVCAGTAVAPINFNVTPAGTVTWTNNNTAIGLGSGSTGNIPGFTASTPTTQITGIITANATSAAGCTSTSSTNLTYTITINSPPGPPVITGGTPNPLQECQNVSPATTITVAPAGGAIPVWYNGNTFLTIGNTYTPPNTTVGTTVYTVIDSAVATGCGSASGGVSLSVTVTINPIPPTPTLSLPTTANDTSCQGSPPTLTVNSGTSTAVWYTIGGTFLQTGSSYTPPASLASGTYTYSVIDSISVINGCINAPASLNTTTLTLTVNPSPTGPILTNTVNPVTECQNQTPATTLSVTPAVGSTPVWYNSSGGVVAINTNTYTPPNGTAGAGIYIVIDSSTVLPNTCTSASTGSILTVTVVVSPSPGLPIYTFPTAANDTSCQGAPPVLTVNTGTIVTNPTAVPVWYTIGGTWLQMGASYTPPSSLTPGTYTYSVIDSIPMVGGCVSALASANTVTLALVVNQSPGPPVLTNTSNIITECQNQIPAGTFTVITSSTPTSVAVWYTSSGSVVAIGTNTYTPPDNVAGNYNYVVIDSSVAAHNTCTSASTGGVLPLTVSVSPTPTQPVLTAPTGVNDTICQNFPTALTVSSGTTTVIPVWYTVGGTFLEAGSSYTPPIGLAPGTYTYSVIDSVSVPNGCTNASPLANTVTLTLLVNPTPTVNVGGAITDSANCGKTGGISGLNVSNISGGTPPYHYQWWSGGVVVSDSLNLTTAVAPGGTYSLQVIDAHGCSAVTPLGTSSTFSVPSVGSPTVILTPSPDSAKGPAPLAMSFSTTVVSTGTPTYVWNFGAGGGNIAGTSTSAYTYTNAGTYTVVLMVSNGSCITKDTVIVITDIPTTVVIPNIFSPNGDGINDQFFIINTGLTTLSCNIFNRWGQLLATLTAPNQSWDGKTPNGDNAPDGTYLYILQAQGINGKTYKQNGTVTLVR